MFNDRLRFLRKEKEYSQRELAKLLNLSSGTIAMYETSKRTPDQETLIRIAKFFGVSIDYLLGESNIREPIETLAFHTTKDLTEDELEEVKKYIEFLRSKRKG